MNCHICGRKIKPSEFHVNVKASWGKIRPAHKGCAERGAAA